MTLISVIVCTHNPREEFLRKVLDGLRSQTFPRDKWELLLIDNASQAPLAGRFDLSWHPGGRHVLENELGLTPARLRGIRESSADVLVFVDDDTVLAQDYLEQALLFGNQHAFIGMWGGNCISTYETPLPSWVGDQEWRLLRVVVKEDAWSNLREGFTTVPAGAGMCVRRAVALRFADRCQHETSRHLGRRGKGLAGYEDAEIAQCAIDLGLGTGLCARLSLQHLVPASRLTLDYFVRHAEGDAASLMLFRASRGLPIQAPRPETLLGSLRWFLHRLINQVPRERYEIDKAHLRGLRKGYQAAQQLLERKQ